jgi:hypothetical protein
MKMENTPIITVPKNKKTAHKIQKERIAVKIHDLIVFLKLIWSQTRFSKLSVLEMV